MFTFTSTFCNKKKYTHNEIFVSDLKVILKSLLETETTPQILLDCLYNLLLTKTSFNDTEIKQLNVFEFLHLLFELRLRSGSGVVVLTLNTDTDKNNTNLHINLDNINNQIIDLINNYPQQVFTKNNFKMFVGIPFFKNIFNLEDPVLSCIYKIEHKNCSIDFKQLSLSQKKYIIEKIPLKDYNYFLKKINEFLNSIQKIDFLNMYNINNLHLPVTLDFRCIVSIIQLLFYENLLNLYQNIFLLCKHANFAPDYIENMTLGELTLYTKMLEITLNNKLTSSTSSQIQTNDFQQPISDA